MVGRIIPPMAYSISTAIDAAAGGGGVVCGECIVHLGPKGLQGSFLVHANKNEMNTYVLPCPWSGPKHREKEKK